MWYVRTFALRSLVISCQNDSVEILTCRLRDCRRWARGMRRCHHPLNQLQLQWKSYPSRSPKRRKEARLLLWRPWWRLLGRPQRLACPRARLFPCLLLLMHTHQQRLAAVAAVFRGLVDLCQALLRGGQVRLLQFQRRAHRSHAGVRWSDTPIHITVYHIFLTLGWFSSDRWLINKVSTTLFLGMAKLQHDVPCAAKDSHLIEWMNTVDPLACTTIMLQRCSREERGFYNCVVVLGWSRLKFSRLYTDIAVTLLFFPDRNCCASSTSLRACNRPIAFLSTLAWISLTVWL